MKFDDFTLLIHKYLYAPAQNAQHLYADYVL